jgi:glycosyltransferase involved in cell wall biosynthesis
VRILFLAYTNRASLAEFINDPKTKLSWIDALLEELRYSKDISLAIAIPINNTHLQKGQIDNIELYGLPNPKERNIFKKVYKKLVFAAESIKVNSYIKTVLDDFNPDIIQIFGTENPFGLIIPEVNKPVIMHIQGFLLVWERKYFAGISRCEQFRYTDFKDLFLRRGHYSDFFTFKKRAKVEEKVILSCDYFMGRTDFDKKVVSLLSPGSKYYHCEEFIRKEFFGVHWNFPFEKEIVCVSILNGATYKGIDLLVEASIILQKHAQFSYKFKICGVSSDEEIVRILKKKYKKDRCFENIEFLGKLDAPALVTQMCNSNFYVHPSYIENSPNSVCEAMVLGMPIVATNVGGVSSIIQDKMEGLLVQEGDPYSFAAAIFELSNNYKFAEFLGKNAKEKAICRHDPNHLVNNLLNIFEQLIIEHGRKGLS